MAMFPMDGTKKEPGYAALPSHDEIKFGRGPSSIEIPLHETTYNSGAFRTARKWLGWITSYEKPKGKEHKPPPKPEPEKKEGGKYSRDDVYVDPRISVFARENVLSDFYRTGVDLELLPKYEMKRRFGDPDGYQMGRNVWANPDVADFPEVAFHEGASALLEELTGRNHYELHDVVKPLELVAAAEYRMGMPNVLERNVRRAMRSLRN